MIGHDQSIRDQNFPILEELIYLNHAGVSPIPRCAADTIREFAAQAENRSVFKADWYDRIQEIKAKFAQLINAAGPGEIALIPNTSTGLSTVAKGLEWRPDHRVIITDAEYPANRYVWEDLKRLGVKIDEIRQDPDGRIHGEDVAYEIRNDTRLVAVSHVQWASGYQMDLKAISDEIHLAGGYLCVDAIQSAGAIPIDVQAMGIDFLAADGHKWMLGPEGAGFLYVREDLVEMLHPNVIGWMNMVEAYDWDQYRFEFAKDAQRFEPGSYNIVGTLAVGASIEMLLEVGIDNVWTRIQKLTAQLCQGLGEKGYQIFSPQADNHERSGIVSIVPREDGPSAEVIVSDLEEKRIIIAARKGRLRISPHFYNTPSQIDQVIEALP